jgi:hypothetical protein
VVVVLLLLMPAICSCLAKTFQVHRKYIHLIVILKGPTKAILCESGLMEGLHVNMEPYRQDFSNLSTESSLFVFALYKLV